MAYLNDAELRDQAALQVLPALIRCSNANSEKFPTEEDGAKAMAQRAYTVALAVVQARKAAKAKDRETANSKPRRTLSEISKRK